MDEPWEPQRNKHVRLVSHWLCEMMILVRAGDADAARWAEEQIVTEDSPLPDSVVLPQFRQTWRPGEPPTCTVEHSLRPVCFRWRSCWDAMQHAARMVPEVHQTRASGLDPPDAAYCTRDNSAGARASGATVYFMVFFWHEPGTVMIGARSNALGVIPVIKCPFEVPEPFTLFSEAVYDEHLTFDQVPVPKETI